MAIFHFVRPTQKDATASPKSRLFDFFFSWADPSGKLAIANFLLFGPCQKTPPSPGKSRYFLGFGTYLLHFLGSFGAGPPAQEIS